MKILNDRKIRALLIPLNHLIYNQHSWSLRVLRFKYLKKSGIKYLVKRSIKRQNPRKMNYSRLTLKFTGGKLVVSALQQVYSSNSSS